MVDLFVWWKQASFAEIMMMLFVVTGFGVIRAMLYVGKNVTETTNNSIDKIGTHLEKIDTTLSKLSLTVSEIKAELKGEIQRIEMRVAVAENELKHTVERRGTPRDRNTRAGDIQE